MWFRTNHPDDVADAAPLGPVSRAPRRRPSSRDRHPFAPRWSPAHRGGIGCELAKILAAAGHNLVLVGGATIRSCSGWRRSWKAGTAITVTPIRPATLASPRRPRRKLHSELRQRSLSVDVLVNKRRLRAGRDVSRKPKPPRRFSLLHVKRRRADSPHSPPSARH